MESAPAEMKRVLVYGGKTGWIGGLMVELCTKEGMIEKIVGRFGHCSLLK